MMLSDFGYALLDKVQGVHSLTMLETPSLKPWSGNATYILTYHNYTRDCYYPYCKHSRVLRNCFAM